MGRISINHPSGRAVTRLSHLPWSSGHDFRLSLTLISAGDRGSIPRGRDFFFFLTFLQSFAELPGRFTEMVEVFYYILEEIEMDDLSTRPPRVEDPAA